MAISGPNLEDLRRRMQRVADGGFKHELLKVLAQEAATQCVKGFQKSRDPYGNPWKPLKYRQGKPLLDTGRLRNDVQRHFVATDKGIKSGSGLVYAAVHNYGFKFIPKRQYLPDNTHGLGPIWGKAFDAATKMVLRQHMGVRR